MTSKPVTFLSYAAVDDNDGCISSLREKLIGELALQTGEEFEVFQGGEPRDIDSRPEVRREAIEQAPFLVAIITPSFFKSPLCRGDVEKFIQRERELGRTDLILPVYYLDVPAIEDPSGLPDDLVVQTISNHQAVDWRSKSLRSESSDLIKEIVPIIRDRLGLRSSGFLPAWRLKELSVADFRCFCDLKVRLLHPESTLEGSWTCIAGINGSGKSGILQAICIALLGQHAQELGGGLLKRVRRRKTASGKPAKIKVLCTQEEGTQLTVSAEIDENGLLKADQPVNPVQNYTVVVGYGATRNLSGELESPIKNMSPAVQRVYGLFYPLAPLASAEVLISDRRRSPDFVPLFESLVRQVFGQELDVVEPSGMVRFAVMDKDEVTALDLPDGFRSSAAWMADLCAAWCDKHPVVARSRNLADIEAIVLIDEIDLHLHPSLQRELVPRLRRALPKVQWIVTTHSPLVLANFDANEIIALDRDREGNVRPIDRQILAFTTDQIYDWLMGTRPIGAAMEVELHKSDGGTGRSSDEIAELLRTSPQQSSQEAKKQVSEFKTILKKLKR